MEQLPPEPRRSRTMWRRVVIALLAVTASALCHLSVVGTGIFAGWMGGVRGPVRERVDIEMREKAPPPPPPEPPRQLIEPPVVSRVALRAPAPSRVEKAEPPKAAQPVGGPPPRVVGLSFESTVEGGDGPAFAVGNTLQGETAREAVNPGDIKPEASGPPAPRGPAVAHNQVASRLPVAGVVFGQAKRKTARKPTYPEALKNQGIEGEVVLLVSIDATGKVTDVKIVRPAPYPEMNESARTSAMAEEYEPATRNGQPVPQTIKYTVSFRLDDT